MNDNHGSLTMIMMTMPSTRIMMTTIMVMMKTMTLTENYAGDACMISLPSIF